MLSDSNAEIGHLQASRQENSPQVSRQLVLENQNRTESDEKKISDSKGSRELAVSAPELKNMEHTNHRYMDKIFQFMQKKLGMSATNASFSMGAYKTIVLILGMFTTSSIKAAILIWAGFLNGRRGQNYVSTLIPFFVSDRCKIFLEQQKDGKAKLLTLRCIRHVKMQWGATEKRLNATGQFSKNFRRYLFFARSSKRWRQRTSSQKISWTGSHLHVNVQRHWVEKNDENCISHDEAVRDYSIKILARTLDISWSRVGREVAWKFFSPSKKGRWNCTANKVAQRFKEIGHLVFKSASVLICGILKQKKGACTTHFNEDSTNTELLFQTVRSSCELVSSIRLKEEEKGQVAIPVDIKILTTVQREEVEMLISILMQTLGNRMQGDAFSFQTLTKNIQVTQLCENFSPNILWSPGRSTKFDRMQTTDGGEIAPLCWEYSSSRSCPKTQAIGPVSEVRVVKILTNMA